MNMQLCFIWSIGHSGLTFYFGSFSLKAKLQFANYMFIVAVCSPTA